MINIKGSFSILVLVATGIGCSTPPAGVAPSELSDLRKQIFELQKVQGVQAGQIDELNNKVLLLNDKIGLRPVPVPTAPQMTPQVTPTAPVVPAPMSPTGIRPSTGATPLSSKSSTVMVATPPTDRGADHAALIYNQALLDAKKPQMVALEKDVRSLLASYKESPVTNNALFLLADTYYARRQYPKAAEQFERLYKLFPDGNKAVGSLYMLGLCYQKMGHPSEAKEAFENVVTIYPGSREALQAEKFLQSETGQAPGESPGEGR